MPVGPGLIPAHAGKTTTSYSLIGKSWAHPRSRGENDHVHVLGSTRRGSSPLTRGKHLRTALTQAVKGLIPAHAGKTGRGARAGRRHGAHPRSRGENALMMRSTLPIQGSSPLTRGKRRPVRWRTHGRGLIPAHAGKTSSPRSCPSQAGAHPRSRGENPGTYAAVGAVQGSSPLTRGKLLVAEAPTWKTRLIPAHAGKTTGRLQRRPGSRAHPRSRGENDEGYCWHNQKTGSSPLTRGKLKDSRPSIHARGLIPAHAGKTPESRPP